MRLRWSRKTRHRQGRGNYDLTHWFGRHGDGRLSPDYLGPDHTGVTTARAAVQISDGQVSYEPPGYLIPDSTGTPRTRVAQSRFCDTNPLRCRYNPNGRKYYWTRDRRMPDSTAAPNQAAWGCGATDGKVRGRSWNFSNRAAALYCALSECSRKTTSGRCHIVSCRPAVRGSYEAIAIWGANAPQ